MNSKNAIFENHDRSPVVRCFHVCKRSREGGVVFDDASFVASAGGIYFILGRGGAGKTSLVKLLAGLEAPQNGQVWIDGKNVQHLSRRELARLRRRMGIVMQDAKLLMDESVAANIALPLEISGMDRAIIEKKVSRIVRAVGLRSKRGVLCRNLSSSERQLTVVARACVNDPFLLIADEPVSQLDDDARNTVVELFDKLNMTGSTLLIASGDDSLPSMFPDCRISVIDEGKIEKKATIS